MKQKILLHLLLIISQLTTSPIAGEILAQSSDYQYYYRVHFRDKGTWNPSSFSASQLLSERAIQRRAKSGISVPDWKDIPVYQDYISQVKNLGFTLHCTSKWLNTGLFKTMTQANLSQLLALPFVVSAEIVKRPPGKGITTEKSFFESSGIVAEPEVPVSMLNGNIIHSAGWKGKGVLIAILDAGFSWTDGATSLEKLRSRNGIKHTYDFVNGSGNVYGYHNHGTAVLSVIAGDLPGVIQGTAPGADFLLLRSEDPSSEYPVEEDFWAAAAEFADSAGADIISSSLGYYWFDDKSQNHTFSDMDGNTTFVTRAADIAASKGILVVSSAGNERNKEWLRIIAPSDGDSVLCIGAVDRNRLISSFSSAGPSYDRRIKPDVAALGVSIPGQVSATSVNLVNGTSFSCPVISGMSACLLDAIPDATNMEIINAIRESAHQFFNPDSLYGYGIPDFQRAFSILLLSGEEKTDSEIQFRVSPNPSGGTFRLISPETTGKVQIEISTPAGITIHKKEYDSVPGRVTEINALTGSADGIYFIKIKTEKASRTIKVLKISSF